MPDELLRYLSGPEPYSPWWLVVSGLLLAMVIGWYAAVLVWTMPADRLRGMPGVRVLHGWWVRRRFAASVADIRARHREGRLSPAQAGAALSRTLRSFLHIATGQRAQYQHLDDLAAGVLAPAAPVVAALNDVQFNTDPAADIDQLSRSVEELIRSWT